MALQISRMLPSRNDVSEIRELGAESSSSSHRPSRVLVIDDGSMGDFVESTARRDQCETVVCSSLRDAIDLAPTIDFDVVLLARSAGAATNEDVTAVFPGALVVRDLSANGAGSASGSIHADGPRAAALAVAKALQHRRLSHTLKRLPTQLSEARRVSGMLGTSVPMVRLFDLVTRVGKSEATVLIAGERGTGKELVARALHDQGPRREGPFVVLDCAALPPALIESALFGDASNREGLFIRARGGTLVLSEVADVPLDLQLRLLRALQERRVRPAGGSAEFPFDVRVVATTSRDLDVEIAEKRFREDLYYRIRVIGLEVPPLRARGDDVLLLSQHFLAGSATRTGHECVRLGAGAADKLLSYDWPGNVGELENCVAHAVSLVHRDEITVQELPQSIRCHRPNDEVWGMRDPEGLSTLEELERRYVRHVLTMVSGDKSKAARILGVERTALRRMLDGCP